MNPISIRLLNQQLIAPQFTRPEDVVAHFGAMQAQEYRMMRWAVEMRSLILFPNNISVTFIFNVNVDSVENIVEYSTISDRFHYNYDEFRYNGHSYQVRPFAIINFSSFMELSKSPNMRSCCSRVLFCGDRAYISVELKQDLFSFVDIKLEVPYRLNMKDYKSR